MKSLKLNLNQIKHLFTRKRKLPGQRNPAHDWFVMLSVTAVLVIFILGSGIFLFLGTDKGSLFTSKNEATILPQTIDQKSIDMVGSFYDRRESELELLKTAEPAVVDPSR